MVEEMIKEYEDNGIKIIIEMPSEPTDKNTIQEIQDIMNNELLLQLQRK